MYLIENGVIHYYVGKGAKATAEAPAPAKVEEPKTEKKKRTTKRAKK